MESFPFVAKKRHRAPSASENPLSREMAVEFADQVNRYWALLGYDAAARVVEIRLLGPHGTAENFTVVSNLRNGIPARRLPEIGQ